MINKFKYPKCLPTKVSLVIGSQYWEFPQSIIVMNGGNGFKYSGNGSASLWKHNSSGAWFGFCVVVIVVEIVGGLVSTHFLEYEFSYLYLMMKGIFLLIMGPIF